MSNSFQVGDRVVITRSSQYYGISSSNPTSDVEGTICTYTPSNDDEHHNIGVDWDNGSYNCYRQCDLEPVVWEILT